MENTILENTRHSIIDELFLVGSFYGDIEVAEFVKRTYPNVAKMPSSDLRYKTAEQDIRQHMGAWNDWSDDYLWYTYLKITKIPDNEFIYFLEQVVHPIIKRKKMNKDYQWENIENSQYVEVINKYLINDGYKMIKSEMMGDSYGYKVTSIRSGVKGDVKNIIFAADGPKPEIVISDALSNNVQIINNEEYCLVYNQEICANGVYWKELVNWYKKEYGKDQTEQRFYERLLKSLDSEPEQMMMQAYYEMINKSEKDLPALIPQVYLYYDPKTFKERGWKLFEHQRMDFLMIFSKVDRVVIEIDGKQHYSNGNTSSPRLYAKMVEAQRKMSLCGYDVYRFGGYEFIGNQSDVYDKLKGFFEQLLNKYGITLN